MNESFHRRAIFNFHGVGEPGGLLEPGEKAVWIDQAGFGALIDEIATRKLCGITFDDGNKSDVEIALPKLLSSGLTGTFFVLTGRIGAPGYLDEGDIRALVASGMKVGLHGRDHVSWRSIDDHGLHREIQEARSALEGVTGGVVTEAACPLGDYGRRTLSHLRSCGFEAVYTSDGGLADMRSWLRPRRTVRSTDGPDLVGRVFAEGVHVRLLRSAKVLGKKWR